MLKRVFPVFFMILAPMVWAGTPVMAADSHQGKVVEVSAGKLTMTDMAGKNQHTHDVASDAAVSCEGKTCGLTDVRAGDIVTVTIDTKDGKTVATKVEAKKAGS